MPAHGRGQDVSFKCLDVCNSLAILPTCAIPLCICFLQESQRGQKQWLVWHESSVMWDRTTTQSGTQGDGRDTTSGCRNSFQLLSDMYNRHLQLRPEERKHSSQGRVSVPVSLGRVPSDEVSLQGAGFPQLSTQGYLGKVAFQTADTPQTSSGAQVRQVTAGTWGWCLGHTTCLQPGPKVALEPSEAQKQTPSWHLLCKAKGCFTFTIYQHTGSKIQKQAKYFSQLWVCLRPTLNCLGVPELAWVKALKWFPHLW